MDFPRYVKDGETSDGKVLCIDGSTWVFNPEPEIFYANGWTDYVPTADDWKAERIEDLTSYYKTCSEHVVIDGEEVHITKAGIRDCRDMADDLDDTGGDAVIDGYSRPVTVRQLQEFIKRVRLHMNACDVVFLRKRGEIMSIDSVEGLKDYDVYSDFPLIPELSFMSE